jgi:lipoate-protein ligase A
MARDHALALSLAPGKGVLRLYRWSSPTVSFGRNEPAAGLYDRRRASAEGVTFVRRPTGGRAVLHDRELTYALVLPLRSLGGARGAHRVIARGLVGALGALGVPARLATAGSERSPAPDTGPCFQRPAADEVVVRGRKLVGSAQVRLGGALLQHGSLLLGAGQDRLDALRVEPRGVPSPATSLAELLDPVPPWPRLVDAVREGLARALGGSWSPGEILALRPDALEDELEARYASEGWTWRR